MATDETPRYLTLPQLVQLSGFSASTIRRRVQDGSLRAIQPGGKRKRLLFPADVLDEIASGDTATPAVDMATTVSAPSAEDQTSAKHSTGPRPKWMRALPQNNPSHT